MIHFRLLTIEFVPTVLKMMEEFNRLNGYPFDRHSALKNLVNIMNDDQRGRLWIIRYEGTMVGYVAFTFGFSFEYRGRDAFVDELFISDGYRNLGIGKAALEYVHGQAINLGVRAVHLEVQMEHFSARKLYDKLGYKENGRALLTKRVSNL